VAGNRGSTNANIRILDMNVAVSIGSTVLGNLLPCVRNHCTRSSRRCRAIAADVDTLPTGIHSVCHNSNTLQSFVFQHESIPSNRLGHRAMVLTSVDADVLDAARAPAGY
jgi:hypothetical protein